ncbi:MarR family transcriptional regulator [Natrialba swarupiae]|uniref:MarR family transcriptional regulator n=1 Tax=Natrialba swarupiae TaxID=2448032 RepID=A0A5D5AGB2_9EURY|nr:helix-turn-helix domain-containing protein [Natrialba swarupiae]TYT60858.1 MarR family transcriptional regulator [Natrialba swarupiae]
MRSPPDMPEDLDLPDLDFNDADWGILHQLCEYHADVPANLAERLDYDRTYIHHRLKRLTEHNILENRGNGVYQINEDLY